MLTLPIKKKWFDMIESGEKKEEYRAMSWYYIVRFCKYSMKFPFYRWVKLRNGYAKNSPIIKCRVKIHYGLGNPEWGAPNEKCFILEILSKDRIQ